MLKRIKDYFEKTKVKIFRLEISLKSLIKLALLYLVILILPKVFHMSLKQTVIFLILLLQYYYSILNYINSFLCCICRHYIYCIIGAVFI